ncbi:class I tRNA ligase family protein, partial [Candidatus Saccharibacteria bacterium]|nr:class I tRNA ligase family protein [Candidatus Saccharibacteria bacterium]
SMPFAQFHYPFENKEKFEANFPGDFIVEYVPQVRAWFYYMNAVNVGLFGRSAFKTALVHGTLAGNDGRKMSKSFGNYTDPNELMDTYSADSLRLLFLSSPLLNGEDFSLIDKDVADVARKLSMIWNMYDFFTMYAEVDGWEWDGNHEDPSSLHKNILDRWIVSRVHQLTEEVERHMDNYDIPNAVKPILPFLDDASNWYVRRSRRRFWKSGDDEDKNNAYRTLHYVLVQLSMILAPFTPFLAEELYQNLTGGESVHLLDWPKAGHVDEILIDEMKEVRSFVNEALAIRAKEGIKVRQPLQLITIPKTGQTVDYIDILTEELNIKKVVVDDKKDLSLDLELTPDLVKEGLMREVIRVVQNARKQAGLNVDDRIKLDLYSNDKELIEAINSNKEIIALETLSISIGVYKKLIKESLTSTKIDGRPFGVKLQKT